ncbi:MAG: tRNA adenosine(34) deaminase TadA [Pontibacterium sp.]
MSEEATTDQHLQYMHHALSLANKAAELGEVPVGAVVVVDGVIVGEGWNRPITDNDPTAHAEVVALRDAAKNVDNYRLVNADMYVTIEPCSMCAGAMVHARIARLIYGATEPKAGVAQSRTEFFKSPWLNHRIEVIGGVLGDECSAKISAFFKQRRAVIKADKKAKSPL